MQETSCEQAVAEYFAAIRAMDVDRWVSLFAEDAVSHDPVGAPPLTSQAARREFFNGILAAFEKIGLMEDHVYLAKNSAAVKWTGNAVARNGKSITFEGVDVIDCNEGGKIIHVRAFWDPAPVMAITQG